MNDKTIEYFSKANHALYELKIVKNMYNANIKLLKNKWGEGGCADFLRNIKISENLIYSLLREYVQRPMIIKENPEYFKRMESLWKIAISYENKLNEITNKPLKEVSFNLDLNAGKRFYESYYRGVVAWKNRQLKQQKTLKKQLKNQKKGLARAARLAKMQNFTNFLKLLSGDMSYDTFEDKYEKYCMEYLEPWQIELVKEKLYEPWDFEEEEEMDEENYYYEDEK